MAPSRRQPLHNIETSKFRPGEYIGYDGTGHVWNISRTPSRQWRAEPAANHPGRFSAATMTARTLVDLAALLAARNPNKARTHA